MQLLFYRITTPIFAHDFCSLFLKKYCIDFLFYFCAFKKVAARNLLKTAHISQHLCYILDLVTTDKDVPGQKGMESPCLWPIS